MKQLASTLRPQLEAVVKQNESAAGDTFVPGDFNQVRPKTASTLHLNHPQGQLSLSLKVICLHAPDCCLVSSCKA